MTDGGKTNDAKEHLDRIERDASKLKGVTPDAEQKLAEFKVALEALRGCGNAIKCGNQ